MANVAATHQSNLMINEETDRASLRLVTQGIAHDSAVKQVCGQAHYIDDLPEPAGCLHLVPIGAPQAPARIIAIDLSQVLTAEGVVGVLTAADIVNHHGANDVSPTHSGDDPVFAETLVRFHREPVAAVYARTYLQARAAARLAKIILSQDGVGAGIWDIAAADQANSLVSPDYQWSVGDSQAALAAANHRLTTSLEIGGQEQFYLEGQVSLALPSEDGDMKIYCSTQHPSEVQQNVAQVLGLASHAVVVEVRRMGGGFGGKESQAAQWAAMAALAARQSGQAVKCRLDRDDDMAMTGKRHDFTAAMTIGFDDEGRICGGDVDLKARCGVSKDLSDAIVDRAMFHFDNASHWPNLTIRSRRLKTNTVSNTAFRGFGGPQGMLAGEWALEAIARYLGEDPLTIRQRNFYQSRQSGQSEAQETPYGMKLDDYILGDLVLDLASKAGYHQRRAEILAWNRQQNYYKKGLALTPVKFGISFTTGFLNQAGALVHIYRDGSISLNHGGTEMGQGLFTKVAQIVADVFQLDLTRVKITATSTDKVPNTSATAASSGSDMNGMAAYNAATILKQRLVAFAAGHYGVAASSIEFAANGRVLIGNQQQLSFAELVNQAYLARVSLSATGYYRTPKIDYNRATGKGRPFYYFAYGAAVSEVIIDLLTGESRVLAVDILHDVGRSLNPAIDKGQIEGGFIQGMGWLTSEELWWDDQGRLRTHAPSTYKIPTCSDRPRHFNVDLWDRSVNFENTIHRSKAVGEPPLMLAISVFMAISDAIASIGNYRHLPALRAPATPEAILQAINLMPRIDA